MGALCLPRARVRETLSGDSPPSLPPPPPPSLSPPSRHTNQVDRAKVLSNTIKQKRKEKAGKWEVPLPKVRPVAEEEAFKVLRTGKRKAKAGSAW